MDFHTYVRIPSKSKNMVTLRRNFPSIVVGEWAGLNNAEEHIWTVVTNIGAIQCSH
jgi:hypothetical protein